MCGSKVLIKQYFAREVMVPVTLESKSLSLLGRCLLQLLKICEISSVVYSRAEHVFILQHCIASKSFAALCKVINKTCSHTEVPIKIRVRQLMKRRDTGRFVRDTCSSSDKAAEITAAPVSSTVLTVITGKPARNYYRHCFSHFVREGVHM